MKKIIFASPKETIEVSCPNWVFPLMTVVAKYLKVKTIKLNNGAKITAIHFDEASD